MRKGIQRLNHTADIGIRVRGKSPEMVFERAACGMISVMTASRKINESEWVEVTFQDEKIDELLLKWLKEILYMIESRGIIFSHCGVVETNFTDKNIKIFKIRGIWKGEKINPKRHDICTEIKAITRHDFYFKKKGSWWEANILFDV